MRFPRRHFFQLAAAAVALPSLPRFAWAESYPSRPVHFIVDLPAGLSPDVIARLVSEPLAERLGQPVVVENRPGAAGNIGAEYVVRAAADGYTLLVAISGNAVNATLYPNLTFNFARDTEPVAFLGYTPFVMVVNPAFPAKAVAEFIAYAKANPASINIASPGAGTAPHLAGELFKMMTGIAMVHVPYKSNYLPDLLGGQVQVAFIAAAPVLGYIQSGKLRALGVTTAKRLDVLPDVPALAEAVPGYEGSGWTGVCAPKNTAGAIVERLNKNINAVIAVPAITSRLAAIGAEPVAMTAAEFGKLIADATDKWAKVIKFAGIKTE
jgi:tripartite-type tricarboxylate transporter receptor subunit TctC